MRAGDRVQVSARTERGDLWASSVTLAAPGDDVVLTLRRAGEIVLDLSLPEGFAPPEGSWQRECGLTLHMPGRAITGPTSIERRPGGFVVRFGWLADGEYAIEHASLGRGEPRLEAFLIEKIAVSVAAGPTHCARQLAIGRTVTGRVVLPPGVAPSSVCLGVGGGCEVEGVEPDGAFVLGGAPRDAFELRVSDDHASETIAVPASATTTGDIILSR